MSLIVFNVVFVEVENAHGSVVASAVCTEACSAVIAENDTLLGSAHEVVDMVMGKERADDVALFKPGFILAGGVVERLGAGSLAHNIVVADKTGAFIERIPLAVVNIEAGVFRFFVGYAVNKLIDFLNGHMLEQERGNNLAAVGSLKLVAFLLVPFNLLGIYAAVARDGSVLVVGIHKVYVKRHFAAVL